MIEFLRGIEQPRLLETVRQFGEPFGYEEERGGIFIHDVRPEAGYEETQSSKGRAEFRAHTDCTFLPSDYRPEFLSLYCIENPARAATLLWPVEDLLASLDPQTIRVLSEPRFRQNAPLTFGLAEPVTGHRVLANGQIAYSAQGTRATDESTTMALEALEAAIQKTPPRRFVLEPGDLLVFSNLQCLHGREAIQGNRWLQRVYLRSDLSALRRDARGTRENVFRAAALLPQPALR